MINTIVTDRRSWLPAGIFLLLVYYSVGFTGLSMPSSRELFIRLMPFSILLSMGLLLLFHHPWSPRQLAVFTAIAFAGFLVEAAGVLTGEIFGQYQYYHALGPKLLDTPLLIGINWLMLVYCVFFIFRMQLQWPPFWAIAAAASLMVVYDLVMEPVAAALSMWSWKAENIPLQNYFAWFVISAVFLLGIHISGIRFQNKLAPWLFGIQLLFFLSLNLYFRFL